MASRRRFYIIPLGLLLIAGAATAYLVLRPRPDAKVVGVVRITELRVAPEVAGQLAAIKVQKGERVQAGDVVAELSAVELTASVAQARASLGSVVANRDHIFAGARAEEVATRDAAISKAKAGLEYAKLQLDRTAYLARENIESKQALDQAECDVATARADFDEAQANYDAAQAGPTREERAIADAQVQAAAAALGVLERRLEKMILRAPADGVVTVIVAEVGENVHPGQPVLAMEEKGKRWLSFNVREELLRGAGIGAKIDVARLGASEQIPSVVTEILPLGAFATWQAERAVGDHDRNTLRLRLDPQADAQGLEPGMTVWLLH
jgi:HlyD family secretion protein